MNLNPVESIAARIASIEQRFGASFAPHLDSRTTDLGRVGNSSIQPGTGDPARVDLLPWAGGNSTQLGSAGWAAELPEAGRPWVAAIDAAAGKAGIDPRLLAALTWAESGFKPTARSGAGAVGLTQLMPNTARGLGVNPADPLQNLEGGARYLRQQLDRFGSPELALAAYNAGPGRVAQAGGVPRIAETQAYVTRVLGHYQRLRSGS